MRLELHRVSGDDYQGWDKRDMYFVMEVNGKERARAKLEVPPLAPRGNDSILARGLYSPELGNVILSVAFADPDGSTPIYPMYSYRVEPESGPWLWFAWISTIALTVLVTVATGLLIDLI